MLERTEDIIYFFEKNGYDVRWDMMSERMLINGQSMNEPTRQVIYNLLYDEGVKSEKRILAVLTQMANNNKVHAPYDYMINLAWDGIDHIGELSAYFTDRHDPIVYADGMEDSVFGAFLRRFLVGVCARVYNHYNDNLSQNEETPQNVVLMLGGGQGLGKSYFAKWLSGPLVDQFTDMSFSPDKQNMSLLLSAKMLWEIGEAQSVFGKVNRNTLKQIVTQSRAQFKHPYGRFNVNKASMCSFIGTFNPDGAFLNDPTGSRRWAIVELEAVEQLYSKEVEVEQIWAQAWDIFIKGKENGICEWKFSDEEVAARNKINGAYTVVDRLDEIMREYFVADDTEYRTRPVFFSEFLSCVYTPDKNKCALEAATWLDKNGHAKVGNPQTRRGIMLDPSIDWSNDKRVEKIYPLILQNMQDNGYNI